MHELGAGVQLSRKRRGVRGLHITRSAVTERSARSEGHPRTNHTLCPLLIPMSSTFTDHDLPEPHFIVLRERLIDFMRHR
jgi:hypothetical protein